MAHPFPLFESIWTPSREIAVTPEVTEALRNGAAVAIGVSGGKDSAATAFATTDYLNEIGHQGPRLLIHSDLGRVEWRQSLSVCERLAEYLAGTDCGTARAWRPSGSLARSLGEQCPPIRGTEMRKTDHALVDGFNAVLYVGTQDRGDQPGSGRSFS